MSLQNNIFFFFKKTKISQRKIKIKTRYILTPSVLSVCAGGPLLADIAKANSSAC